MRILIQITDEETVDGIKAVGAKDLKEHFLQKIGIKADLVTVTDIDQENAEKRLLGEEYTFYEDQY